MIPSKIKDIHWAWIIALPAVLYIHWRAATLSFTYDECWTFLGYARGDIMFTLLNHYPAANNHILHSVLMFGSYMLFGMSEYALRIPVLLSFFLFVHFLFKTLNAGMRKGVLASFTMLIYQPYLLDYFVLARGYGMAIAFMIGGIYFTWRYLTDRRLKDLSFALLFGFLSAYSNFTYLLFFIAEACVLAVATYSLRRAPTMKESGVSIGIITLALACFFTPLKGLVQSNELYYGGVDGFYTDTLVSLANAVLYGNPGAEFLAMIFAVIIVGALIVQRQERLRINHPFAIIAGVLLLICVGTILQNFLLDTPFLIDRTALILLPLILILSVFMIDRTANLMMRKGLIAVLLIATGLNMMTAFNLRYTFDFKQHADANETMRTIGVLSANEKERFTIAKSTFFNALVNYYAIRYELDMVKQSDLTYCAEGDDVRFYWLSISDRSCVEDKDVTLIKNYPLSGTILYAAKK